MSNALVYTENSHGFASDILSERADLTASAVLCEAMQSTHSLLALSTVARLMLDTSRRHRETSSTQPEGSSTLAGMRQAFAHQAQHQDANGDLFDLDCRIRELETSLKRISVSSLPDMTKNMVRQRILGQIDLLRGQLAVETGYVPE